MQTSHVDTRLSDYDTVENGILLTPRVPAIDDAPPGNARLLPYAITAELTPLPVPFEPITLGPIPFGANAEVTTATPAPADTPSVGELYFRQK